VSPGGLEGKVVVVVGGTSGLGLSGVQACLAAGARARVENLQRGHDNGPPTVCRNAAGPGVAKTEPAASRWYRETGTTV